MAGKILYYPAFIKAYKKLDPLLQMRARRIEKQFRENPLHPSLRLHRLKGNLQDYWSISVTMHVRIIFKQMTNSDIVFLSIGHHDIYRNL